MEWEEGKYNTEKPEDKQQAREHKPKKQARCTVIALEQKLRNTINLRKDFRSWPVCLSGPGPGRGACMKQPIDVSLSPFL